MAVAPAAVRVEEIPELEDDRGILWHSCDAKRIDKMVGVDTGRRGRIQVLGLEETLLIIRWPFTARKAVIEFVSGFDQKTRSSVFRGRTLKLTTEFVREAFRLPSGLFSKYKHKWSCVELDRMFSRPKERNKPLSLTYLSPDYMEWDIVIRIVLMVLLGKSNTTVVSGKHMWYFYAYSYPELASRRTKKRMKPTAMPDWADLVCDELTTELVRVKNKLLTGSAAKKYPTHLGTPITQLLISWGYTVESLHRQELSFLCCKHQVLNSMGVTVSTTEEEPGTDPGEETREGCQAVRDEDATENDEKAECPDGGERRYSLAEPELLHEREQGDEGTKMQMPSLGFGCPVIGPSASCIETDSSLSPGYCNNSGPQVVAESENEVTIANTDIEVIEDLNQRQQDDLAEQSRTIVSLKRCITLLLVESKKSRFDNFSLDLYWELMMEARKRIINSKKEAYEYKREKESAQHELRQLQVHELPRSGEVNLVVHRQILQKEIKALKERIPLLMKEAEEAKQEAAELKKEIREAISRSNGLTGEGEGGEVELARSRQEFSNEMAAMKKEADAEKDRLEQDILQMVESNRTLASDLKTAEQVVKKVADEAKLEKANVGLEMQAAYQKIVALTNSREEGKMAEANLRQEMKAAVGKIAVMEKEAVADKVKLLDSLATNKSLAADKEEAQQETTKLQQKMKEAVEQINVLTKEREGVEVELARSRQEVSNEMAAMKEAAADKDRLEQQILQLRESNATLASNMKTAEQLVKKVQDEAKVQRAKVGLEIQAANEKIAALTEEGKLLDAKFRQEMKAAEGKIAVMEKEAVADKVKLRDSLASNNSLAAEKKTWDRRYLISEVALAEIEVKMKESAEWMAGTIQKVVEENLEARRQIEEMEEHVFQVREAFQSEKKVALVLGRLVREKYGVIEQWKSEQKDLLATLTERCAQLTEVASESFGRFISAYFSKRRISTWYNKQMMFPNESAKDGPTVVTMQAEETSAEQRPRNAVEESSAEPRPRSCVREGPSIECTTSIGVQENTLAECRMRVEDGFRVTRTSSGLSDGAYAGPSTRRGLDEDISMQRREIGEEISDATRPRKRHRKLIIDDDASEFDRKHLDSWIVVQREPKTKVDDSELSSNINIDPGMMQGIALLPHQVKGIRWMCSMEDVMGDPLGGILADEQGMGKTVQLIGLMIVHREAGKPTLICCPKSVVKQWEKELTNKVSPDKQFSVLLYEGAKSVCDYTKYEVVIASHAAVRSASSVPKKRKKGGSESAPKPGGSLESVKWLRVIVDECQVMKNMNSTVSVALRQLDAEFRWCVSGTPFANTMNEVYSYSRFLRLSYLYMKDNISAHRREMNRYTDKQKYEAIHKIIVQCTLRRKKDTLGLPPASRVIVPLQFKSQNVKEMYKRVKKKIDNLFKESGDKVDDSKVLTLILRARQVCVHPGLLSTSADEFRGRDATQKKELTEKRRAELAAKLVVADNWELYCTICQAEFVDGLRPDSVSPCGHYFCYTCAVEVEGDVECNVCPAPGCGEDFSEACLYRMTDMVRQEAVDEDSVGEKPEEPVHEDLVGFETEDIPAKFEAIINYVKGLPPLSARSSEKTTEKAIIFSQWPTAFQYLQRALDENCIRYRKVIGSMNLGARVQALEEFSTDPDVQVILLSLQAASSGLNITAANHVLFLDQWWNPAVEDQAVDRAHRMGQTKQVKVVHFVMSGTIEEIIIHRQKKKRTMAEAVLHGNEFRRADGSHRGETALAWRELIYAE